MRRRIAGTLLTGLLCLLPGRTLGAQKRKNQEPKSQVQPLPPEPPMALEADTDTLDFHISPLLTTGALSAQIRRSLNDLIRDTHGETILRLRAFVAGSGDARQVRMEVAQLFTDHKLPLPVLTILQVGALGHQSAQVVIEAVVSTHRSVNPNGLAFFFGQRGANLEGAIARLKEDAEKVSVPPDHILSTTCFTSGIDNFDATAASLRASFPHTQVNVVQAERDPLSDASMCEAVAQLPAAAGPGSLEVVPAAKAALVQAPKLILTGMQLSFGSFLDDAHEAFARLERSAAALDPSQVPVMVDAFTLDASAGSALRKTNKLAPGVFSVQTVEGLPAIDATAGIEAILVHNPHAALHADRTDATIHSE